jgi:hypothetical protein
LLHFSHFCRLTIQLHNSIFNPTPLLIPKCHVLGVCMTYKMYFGLMIEFIGPLYNLLQHFTNHYLRLEKWAGIARPV